MIILTDYKYKLYFMRYLETLKAYLINGNLHNIQNAMTSWLVNEKSYE